MIWVLLQKEFMLELRRKAVISGLALYLLSSVFIVYLTFQLRQNLLTPLVWGALFWMTVLFTAVNAVAKSFMGEQKARDIYYYSIASPAAILVSKMIYNFLLCAALSFSGFLLFILFFGNPMANALLFCITILLTSAGFAASLTVLSAIASKAGNGSVLMAVMSFPVIMSLLLNAIRVTKNCIDDLDPSVSYQEILVMLAINCLIAATSYLLFPYIWRS
jgi:heme exporter protein B